MTMSSSAPVAAEAAVVAVVAVVPPVLLVAPARLVAPVKVVVAPAAWAVLQVAVVPPVKSPTVVRRMAATAARARATDSSGINYSSRVDCGGSQRLGWLPKLGPKRSRRAALRILHSMC
jgi:hypothetical protein